MPFDALEIRVSLQKLLIGLILVIVPLSFVGLYLTSESDTALEQTLGIHFRTIAQTEGAATAQFINDRTLDVAALAVNPASVEARRELIDCCLRTGDRRRADEQRGILRRLRRGSRE